MHSALRKTFSSLLRPQVFILLLVPFIVSILCWAIVFWFFGGEWIAGLTNYLLSTGLMNSLQSWFSFNATEALGWIGTIILILLFLPLTYLTATLLTSILVMPLLVLWLTKNEYADLEQKKGGSLAGSVLNSLKITMIYVFAMTLTLPLWLLPGGAIVIPLLLGAWLNKRIFTYDSLQDFASREEYLSIINRESRALFGMGLFLGLFNYVPGVSFILPVIMGLTYAHYCLQSLREYRSSAFVSQ